MRTSIYLTQQERQEIDMLQRLLGTASMNETIILAVRLARALRSDPVASLAAAGVTFDTEVIITVTDTRVRVACPKKENTMAELHDIRVSFTYDSLFDGCDASELAGVDQAVSMDNYERLVTHALEDAYPGSHVEVLQRRGNYTRVNGRSDHPEADAIQDILDEIHQSWEWVVEMPE